MSPFKLAKFDPTDEATIKAAMKLGGVSRKKAVAYIEDSTKGEVYLNDTYQVLKRDADVFDEKWPPMYWLSIKRIDREPIHDWRDLQLIKNMLVGGDNEAVELYPAESRLTDTANQYHLWVLKDAGLMFPFGFAKRIVTDEKLGNAKQRPFSK